MTVKNPTNSERLINKIEKAKEKVKMRIFHQWNGTTTLQTREQIYAKMAVLDDVVFALIKDIREE